MILCCDKPSGLSSHGLVALARKALGTRAVGHAGTLDPMATGLLVLGVGQGLKVLRYLALDDKVYEASIRLGVATSTLDAEGSVVEEAPLPASLTRDRVDAAARRFIGTFVQRAPAVSALKQNGVPLHVRVRRGEPVTGPEREVVVHGLEVSAVSADQIDLTVRCGKGFYVRSLARDLALELGTVGHLRALRRTRSGAMTLDGSAPIDELRAAAAGDEGARRSLRARIVPIREALAGVACATLDAAGVSDARHGRPIALERVRSGAPTDPQALVEPVLLCDEAEQPVALGRLERGTLRVVRGLLDQSDSR